ncbi:unnamed protein product [Effrenium voratum]|uniref:Uncharacterized protein n=1 Tax=Effrenium voratum TaxID=2562239 RepID=A0AA36HR14_9DINO|nr:unnamed protein product [Effrenium voratum]
MYQPAYPRDRAHFGGVSPGLAPNLRGAPHGWRSAGWDDGETYVPREEMGIPGTLREDFRHPSRSEPSYSGWQRGRDLYSDPLGPSERHDLYSDPRGLRNPPYGSSLPQDKPRPSFGARAWEPQRPWEPQYSRRRENLFEEQRAREATYGLPPPEGLSVPGFEPYLTEKYLDASRAQDLHEQLRPEKGPSPKAAAFEAPEAVSSLAMQQLQGCEVQLREAGQQLLGTQRALHSLQVTPGQARNDLAQLEAHLEKLQCQSIDSVSTAGLSSEDQDAARSFRRQLTKAVEKLQGQLDQTFEDLKGR